MVRRSPRARRAGSSSRSCRTTIRRRTDVHSKTNKPGATTSTPRAIHERQSDLACALSSSTTSSLSARLASTQTIPSGTFLLPYLTQCLGRGSPHARPTAQRVLYPFDPAQHLPRDRPWLGVCPLEPFEVFHPDQGCLGATPGRKHDPLATMGGVVHERGQTIAGLTQADMLHGASITPQTPNTPEPATGELNAHGAPERHARRRPAHGASAREPEYPRGDHVPLDLGCAAHDRLGARVEPGMPELAGDEAVRATISIASSCRRWSVSLPRTFSIELSAPGRPVRRSRVRLR